MAMKRTVVGHTREDVSTLPRWARERIARLTDEVEHWKSIALSASSPDKTNVTIVDGLEERGLPPNSRVKFRMGKDAIEVSVSSDMPGRHPAASTSIEVRSSDGSLSILPAASNTIYVRINDR